MNRICRADCVLPGTIMGRKGVAMASESEFEPNIVCFLCKWCAYAGADLAGTSRMPYSAAGTPIRVMCSSRVSPEHVLAAFQKGADGVLIGACHPGDCHYQSGNYKTRRRMALLQTIMEEFGVSPRRLKLEWISASEGRRFADVMDAFAEELKELGALPSAQAQDVP
jgi:F420-non-reducing hydrogenase iron-sulfur subunit